MMNSSRTSCALREGTTSMPISHEEFRRTMSHWASGVTVVTTRRPGGIHGMTASSFCSVSLDPPLVLVCVDRRNRTHANLVEQGAFCAHILAEGQEELSQQCAGRMGERGSELHGVPYREGATGAPILDGCLAYLDCRVLYAHDGGDHTIFVGQIEEAGVNEDARPLLYFRGAYHRLDA
jgi:flavin reductase (DIM6/NTAB) family NADH-FMN oxidoreductase RutF